MFHSLAVDLGHDQVFGMPVWSHSQIVGKQKLGAIGG
jgi:hypothetical protein